jgi:hypothetical protein
MKKNKVIIPSKVTPAKEITDCSYCKSCKIIPYSEYDSCYYVCGTLNRIVGDEGHPGYEGFPPNIPNDCPKLGVDDELSDFDKLINQVKLEMETKQDAKALIIYNPDSNLTVNDKLAQTNTINGGIKMCKRILEIGEKIKEKL